MEDKACVSTGTAFDAKQYFNKSANCCRCAMAVAASDASAALVVLRIGLLRSTSCSDLQIRGISDTTKRQNSRSRWETRI